MKWNDSVGSYKAIVSLGSTCQTAHQLSRMGLRRSAGPLDWFVTRSVPGLTQLLHRRFEDFMAFHRLQLVGSTAECFTVRDSQYDVVSFHDFPLSPSPSALWDAYPAFKAQVDRRVQRFWLTVQMKPVLFVRTDTSFAEALQLQSALNPITRGNHRMLIVNAHTDGNPGIIEEDWRTYGISAVKVPPGFDWRGADGAWDAVMSGFSISGQPPLYRRSTSKKKQDDTRVSQSARQLRHE